MVVLHDWCSHIFMNLDICMPWEELEVAEEGSWAQRRMTPQTAILLLKGAAKVMVQTSSISTPQSLLLLLHFQDHLEISTSPVDVKNYQTQICTNGVIITINGIPSSFSPSKLPFQMMITTFYNAAYTHIYICKKKLVLLNEVEYCYYYKKAVFFMVSCSILEERKTKTKKSDKVEFKVIRCWTT